jgi:hypothetical protein
MSRASQTVLAGGTRHTSHWRAGVVSRLIILSSAALSLCGSSVGCSRPPPEPTSGEVTFGKMRAAIESVSRGIVHVEDQTPTDNGRSSVKSTFRLVFDDGQKVLRCDHERLSLRTKYARTPAESLFQYADGAYEGAIEIGPPDRDFSSSDQQPLEPHLLWFAGAGGYRSRQRYADILDAWAKDAREATVSKDSAGRVALSWTKRFDGAPENIRTLTLDPALGFVPVRNEVALRLDGWTEPKVNAWTDIRYEKKNDSFVPVSLEIHQDGDRTIKVTCRWESVNADIDPKIFTVDGFEARKGTAIFDLTGPQPVQLGFTGPVAQAAPGRQGP